MGGLQKVGEHGKKAFGKVGGFFQDFKDFVNKGNVIDLAIGVIIGAAFGLVVKSLVADIFTPCISLLGKVAMSEMFVVLRYGIEDKNKTPKPIYETRQEAKDQGSITLNYGNFIETFINFLIVAFALFLFIKLIMMMKRKEAAAAPSTDWACPKCMEVVKEGATRCSHCAAEPIAPPPPETDDVPGEKAELLA